RPARLPSGSAVSGRDPPRVGATPRAAITASAPGSDRSCAMRVAYQTAAHPLHRSPSKTHSTTITPSAAHGAHRGHRWQAGVRHSPPSEMREGWPDFADALPGCGLEISNKTLFPHRRALEFLGRIWQGKLGQHCCPSFGSLDIPVRADPTSTVTGGGSPITEYERPRARTSPWSRRPPGKTR